MRSRPDSGNRNSNWCRISSAHTPARGRRTWPASRCKPSLLKSGRVFLPLNLAGTVILIGFTVVLGWAISTFAGLSLVSLVLALAPGGITEMSLVASSMQVDVLIVAAFHLVRLLLIIVLSVPLMHLFANTPGPDQKHR